VGTAALKSLLGHWRRLSIALHCPHIYRPSHSHPLQRATTGRRAALTTSIIGPKARSGGIWTCVHCCWHSETQQLSARIESSQPSAPCPRVAELHAQGLPLGLCTRCTSPILTHIGLGTVWPDKPWSPAMSLGALQRKRCVLENPIARLPAFCAGPDELGGAACSPARTPRATKVVPHSSLCGWTDLYSG
jgi:hypothetical protein